MPDLNNPEELKAFVKDIAGQVRADIMEENARLGAEALAKNGGVAAVVTATPTIDAPKVMTRSQRKEAYMYKSEDELTREESLLSAGRCISLLKQANNMPTLAIDLARKAGYTEFADTWDKALSQSIGSEGGYIIPPGFSEAVIESLIAKSTVLDFGVTRMPMNGSLTLPFVGSDATAAYVGENTNAVSSQPSFGQLNLSDKKLISLVPMSNDLLLNGGPAADMVISRNMVKVMAAKMDVTFIRSLGVQNEPKGMKGWVDADQAANALIQTTSPTAATKRIDLGRLITQLAQNDVELDGAGFIWSPRTEGNLRTETDTGVISFANEMAQGTVLGFPFKKTSQIPNNLAVTATDESEIYFAAFPWLVLAESEDMRVQSFDGAAYHDGSAVVSAVSQDQSVMRIISKHDFGAQHRGQEIAYLTDVDWGS